MVTPQSALGGFKPRGHLLADRFGIVERTRRCCVERSFWEFRLPAVSTRAFLADARFPNCVHPGVTAKCDDDWCFVPPGCYIYGSPEDTIGRGAVTEDEDGSPSRETPRRPSRNHQR